MEEKDLRPSTRDHLTSTLRAAGGAVPVVGPFISELITNLVPGQRADRIAAFLEELSAKVDRLASERVDARIRTPEFIDLFEAGAYQAARAASPERRTQIVNLLTNSLNADEIHHTDDKRLLETLGELNDVEILILMLHAKHGQARDEFFETHRDALVAPPAFLGGDQKDIDRSAMQESYRARLVDKGLLKPRFDRPKRNELPELDPKTGMMKARGHGITRLGSMLVERISTPGEPDGDS